MKKYIIVTSFLFLSLFALGVEAQTPPTGSTGNAPTGSTQNTGKTDLENPFKGVGNSLQDLFVAIINRILLPIGSVIAVIAFIYSGFLFVMAQGKPAEIETAKKALLYTAIGTALLLGASVLANVITGTINSLR